MKIKSFLKHIITMKGSKHCELSAFSTWFVIAALVISVYIMFYKNQEIGNNLVVLFGLSTMAGIIAIFWYKYANKKFPFN